MGFLDVVWLIVISFAFVAYLMVMFSIVADLVRDGGSSGWVKAIWLTALIVLPFLTALLYVVARGRGMAERAARAQADLRAEQEASIRDVASAETVTGQIAQAKALLDSGTITEAEFAAVKRQLIGRDPALA